MTSVDPKVILERDHDKSMDTKHTSRIVVIGASIMGHLIPYLRAGGVEVIDLTTPGWVPTEAGLAEVLARLQGVPREGSVYVLDLLGNSTTRYVQYDGTLAIPTKLGGGLPPGW